MASVTFTAVLPNGEIATRTTKTMAYVAVLAWADKGEDNWGARSWHLTRKAALAAATTGSLLVNYKVLDVEITKVVGKTIPGTELHAIKARLADAAKAGKAEAQAGIVAAAELWGADLLADVAEAVAEESPISPEDIDATSDVMAEMLAPAQTVAEATAYLDAVKVAVDAALAEAKADAAAAAAAKMSLAQKRELGTTVHDRIRSVLDRLPEGIDPAEAAAAVETWLLYIPKNRTEESAGMTADQKRELGSAVRALAEEALVDLPAGVAPASALRQLDTWFTYIPQAK